MPATEWVGVRVELAAESAEAVANFLLEAGAGNGTTSSACEALAAQAGSSAQRTSTE